MNVWSQFVRLRAPRILALFLALPLFQSCTQAKNASVLTASGSAPTSSQYIFNVKDFGAKGNGVADDTRAIQAALTAGAGNVVQFPAGVYFVSATLVAKGNTTISGAGPNSTILYRTGNYGNTLTIGSRTDPSDSAWAAQVSGIWFQHGQRAGGPINAPGQTVLANRATVGTHIELNGAQGTVIDNVWFTRMPYQVVFNGGSLSRVENCVFQAIYDPLAPGLQEGLAELYFRPDPLRGNPTSNTVTDSKFMGSTIARSVTITDSGGSFVTTPSSFIDNIGPPSLVLIEGLEDGILTNNYYGGQSQSAVKVSNASLGAVIDLRILSSMFDGGLIGLSLQGKDAGAVSGEVVVANNVFNGQGNSKNGIVVFQNIANSGVSAQNLTITGNTFNGYYASPMLLTAASAFLVNNNSFFGWNALSVSTSDAQFTAPVWVAGVSSAGQVSNNNFLAAGGGTQTSVKVDPSATGITVQGNSYTGTSP